MEHNSLNQQRSKKLIYLTLVLILSIITFSDTFNNGFVNLDDPGYVTDNLIIRNLSFQGIRDIFSSFVMGNYHPLTVLFYSLLYFFFRLNPLPYHVFNLVIHLLNVILVFDLAYKLITKHSTVDSLQKTDFSLEASAFVACLFAVHPMHAENVNWISDLKDLLYTFFYLGSLICYVNCLDFKVQRSKFNIKKSYIASLLLFILSLLSKPSAVTLPVVLFLTDYYFSRRITRYSVLEKIPFFILSLIFGVITIYSQKPAFTIILSINDRLFLPFYNLVYYICAFFLPLKLSAVHPLPLKADSFSVIIYFIYPLILLIIMALTTLIAIKYKIQRRILIFGFLFFLITISLVIQITPVGFCIVAERYTYLPYLGLLFIIGGNYTLLKEKSNWLLTGLNIMIILIIIALSVLTYQRNKIWANSMTLYTDAINKFPDSPIAHNNRGIAYYALKKNAEAENDFLKAISLKPDYAEAYYNLGTVYYNQAKYDEAIKDFTKAISFKPDYIKAYYNRGNSYISIKEYEKGIQDFDKAISLKPDYAEAYNNRGISFFNLKKYDEAVISETKAIELNPGYALAYNNRGNANYNLKKYDEAVRDFTKAIEVNPNFALSYNNRGSLYFSLKKYDEAINDFKKLIELQPDKAEGYFMTGFIYLEKKDYENSIIYFNKCLETDNKCFYAIFGLVFANIEKKDYDLAEIYLKQADDIEPMVKEGMEGMKKLEKKGFIWTDSNTERLKKVFEIIK
jgi:protein O-mannosyl-transferase